MAPVVPDPPSGALLPLYAGSYEHKPSSVRVKISVVNSKLQIEDLDLQDQKYGIKLHERTATNGYPIEFIPTGTVTPAAPRDRSRRTLSQEPAGRHISFFLKGNTVGRLIWKKDGIEFGMQFQRMSTLLSLPEELRSRIFGLALTDDGGEIHMREEQGHLRLAICNSVPYADARNGFANYGDVRSLPKAFNALQYTSRELFTLTRGLELRLNDLKLNGWTFDTFRRLEHLRPTPPWFWTGPDWFDNVRNVTLVGDFKVGKTADENILHGILNFGRAHPKANIFVGIESLRLKGKTLPAFVMLVWLIREAVRGIVKTGWKAQGDKKSISKWRWGKSVDWMNVQNVRFIPSDDYDEAELRKRTSKYKKNKKTKKNKKASGQANAPKEEGVVGMLVQELGGVDEFLEYVKNIYKGF
ncbi:uncharacterized protein J4E92_008696 [Alternaria infectoria]|uniref:uncharacterized protein n=1 Tax=Alternaria infectoria TaxID=45303 RepID=UPI0022207F86|nr:uncharacterized protein J4E92_008696 [Alternaria infectoria]KAI4919052.1 hypothetical protein J4E92_008696 [Alternaria infectoria]